MRRNEWSQSPEWAATAAADGRAFPPDDCSPANPFMAFTAVDGSNTYCINGQNVLSNALPSCGADQIVSYNVTAFYCKTNELEVPACAAGEFLTSDGEGFSCSSTSVPTCAANYVLTYNGSAFTCVPKSATVPTCGANQFLTYNGTDFQCAATQTLTIPNCPSGQVLTGSGGNLTCVADPSSASTGMWCGYAEAYCGNDPNNASYTNRIPCQGSNLSVSCAYSDSMGQLDEWTVSQSSWTGCPTGFTVIAYKTGHANYGGYPAVLTSYAAACVKN